MIKSNVSIEEQIIVWFESYIYKLSDLLAFTVNGYPTNVFMKSSAVSCHLVGNVAFIILSAFSNLGRKWWFVVLIWQSSPWMRSDGCLSYPKPAFCATCVNVQCFVDGRLCCTNSYLNSHANRRKTTHKIVVISI